MILLQEKHLWRFVQNMSCEFDSASALFCFFAFTLLRNWLTWVTPQCCNRPSGPLGTNRGESCNRVCLLACVRVGSLWHVIGSRSVAPTTATGKLRLARLQSLQKCSWYSGCRARFFFVCLFLISYLFIFFETLLHVNMATMCWSATFKSWHWAGLTPLFNRSRGIMWPVSEQDYIPSVVGKVSALPEAHPSHSRQSKYEVCSLHSRYEIPGTRRPSY